MVKHGEFHLNNSTIKQTLTLHVIITKLNSYDDAIHGFLRNRGLISSQTLNEDVKRIGKCVLNRLSLFQCAALVGEDQPLCPDLPELDLLWAGFQWPRLQIVFWEDSSGTATNQKSFPVSTAMKHRTCLRVRESCNVSYLIVACCVL